MAVVDGSNLPVDQIDHVVSILFNDHCSTQQWVDDWNQIKQLQLIPTPPHERAAAIQHAVRQYWTKGIETSIIIILRAKID